MASDERVVASPLAADLLDAVNGDRRRVSTGMLDRRLHGQGLSLHPPRLPDLVVYPVTAEEVSRVVRVASRHRVPVTPWGAGSSLEGNAIPVAGGIVLDLGRLDRIVTIDAVSMTAVVQAGVTRTTLDRQAARHGLRFPIDPGADATLGGMAATNAAGPRTVRYGKMRDNVLGLRAVLADGTAIRAGAACSKTSAGYDVTSLMVGSEGTLGVITELTVRLSPIPESSVVVRASLSDIGSACRAAASIVARCPEAERIELLDTWMVEAVATHSHLDLPSTPLLWVELGGREPATRAAAHHTRDVFAAHGATRISTESDPTRQAELWSARHRVHFAKKARAPGRESVTLDTCVPLSAFAGAIEFASATLTELGLIGGIAAHAGNGNFHVGLMVDPHDEDEMGRASELAARVVNDALGRGRTCSGEHGIGIGKRAALLREHGDLVPLMRTIKTALDPGRLMNPGKIFDP